MPDSLGNNDCFLRGATFDVNGVMLACFIAEGRKEGGPWILAMTAVSDLAGLHKRRPHPAEHPI